MNREVKKYIAKSNDFVSMPKKMSASQRNLLNAILTRVKMNTHIEYVDFTLHELSGIMGVKVTNYEQFRELLQSMKTVLVDKVEAEGISMDSLIGKATLKNNNMGVRFNFTDLANEHFIYLRGKAYTKQLAKSSMFRSIYSHELWDMMSSIKNQKNRSVIISLEDFKIRLGVGEGAYREFSQFRIRVIDPAIREINTKTGMKLTYEQIKVGKGVGFLNFKIASITEEELGRYKEPELFPPGAIPSLAPSPLAWPPPEGDSEEEKLQRAYLTLKKEFRLDEADALLYCKSPHVWRAMYEIRKKAGTPAAVKDAKAHLHQAFYYGKKQDEKKG